MDHRGDRPGAGSRAPDAASVVSRRALLGAAAAGAAGVVLGGASASPARRVSGSRSVAARLTAAAVRQPGSLPHPSLARGPRACPRSSTSWSS